MIDINESQKGIEFSDEAIETYSKYLTSKGFSLYKFGDAVGYDKRDTYSSIVFSFRNRKTIKGNIKGSHFIIVFEEAIKKTIGASAKTYFDKKYKLVDSWITGGISYSFAYIILREADVVNIVRDYERFFGKKSSTGRKRI